MGILTGVVIHRTGGYIEIIWIGTIFMTLGFGLLINLNAQSTLREIVPFEVVAGIGSGLLFEPPLIALQTLVSQGKTPLQQLQRSALFVISAWFYWL